MQEEQNLFRHIQKALWLLTTDYQVICKTKLAEELEQVYPFDLKKIVEISLGQGCALHSTKKECLQCPLEETISAAGFPFKSLTKESELAEFWGRVDFSEDQLMLQIEPVAEELPGAADHSVFDYLNGVREMERKKIAQDLHDGIAQSVYSLMLETRGLKWIEKGTQAEKLQEIDRHFSEVLTEIKNLAGELRPMSLDEFGLVPALEQFIKRTIEMTGFEIDFLVTGCEQPLVEAARTAVYRIIQEAIANAMKYSGENQASILLDFKEDTLAVTVEDAGQGFNLAKEERGFGLLNMKERAHAVSGELTIESEPAKGTKVFFTIPVRE
ncbi:two-component sensor histidine kinase [Enterococcus sp. JM4C]|uniref:sensor histidine kinase n=1 Tax=Candidatus Enterococcus huntleyi TaxID=1857217 RepID=UPI00137B4CD5|nr:sensor histidine kinase [Enterococcus sp. JM4C]KAF1299258.1 two-component sensor histidine kinase [Enterococcus sp. JM4C]